jgi:hypothetical protein
MGIVSRMIQLPAAMYDKWEAAYREELKRLYPSDDRQVIQTDPKRDRENFIFRGHVFMKAGG